MNTPFMQSLADELKPSIKRLIEHPFLAKLKSGKLTVAQLSLFAGDYYYYCCAFPRMLAAVAANTPDDETRLNLIINLWEEHGEGDLQRSHRTLYRNFMSALKIDALDLESHRPHAGVESYINECMAYCKEAHFLAGMSFLGPGAEMFTGEEYTLILNGLRGYHLFDEKHLEFWAVHIDGDDKHYSIMASAIETWATNDDNIAHIRHGAKNAIATEYAFWTAIEDHVNAGV